MTILTREAILAADDRKTKEVNVPEWGGKVIVKSLTGAERERIVSHMIDNKKDNQTSYKRLMVILAVVDDKGKRVFTEKDFDLIGEKCPSAIDRISDAVEELNALRNEDAEESEKK